MLTSPPRCCRKSSSACGSGHAEADAKSAQRRGASGAHQRIRLVNAARTHQSKGWTTQNAVTPAQPPHSIIDCTRIEHNDGAEQQVHHRGALPQGQQGCSRPATTASSMLATAPCPPHLHSRRARRQPLCVQLHTERNARKQERQTRQAAAAPRPTTSRCGHSGAVSLASEHATAVRGPPGAGDAHISRVGGTKQQAGSLGARRAANGAVMRYKISSNSPSRASRAYSERSHFAWRQPKSLSVDKAMLVLGQA